MKWKKINSKIVHKNPWYKVTEDNVIRPDGKKGKYYVIKMSPIVIIIPVLDNKILLVNQYRYPISRDSWELPMGSIENGENGLSAAKRELQEETGFIAKKWKLLGKISNVNGAAEFWVNVYLAQVLKAGSNNREASEQDMKMKKFSLSQIETMIRNGKIIDLESIGALYQYKLSKR